MLGPNFCRRDADSHPLWQGLQDQVGIAGGSILGTTFLKFILCEMEVRDGWMVRDGLDGRTVFTFGDTEIELAAVQSYSDGVSGLSTSVWAASILLSRLLVKMKNILSSKTILEVTREKILLLQ